MAALVASVAPALAQGWTWPWEQPKPPVPREPVYRDRGPLPPGALPPPGGGSPASPGSTWGQKSNICLQLEQQLVAESQRGGQSKDLLPKLEADIRNYDRIYQQGERQLERNGCYEQWLFTKSLRRDVRQCVDLANQVESAKRQLTDLNAQRQQLMGLQTRSYQDEIIRELARNNCGTSYQQEAARRSSGPFSSLWQDDEAGPGAGGAGNQFGNLPFATYRTLCVRLCDGYYFPISFSTLPNHFQRDAELCQSKCAAPVELYYHQNPGGAVDQMVSFKSQAPYTQLRSAFRYRKELIQGCSCKQADYVPAPGTAPPPDRRAEGLAPVPTAAPRR